MKIKVWDSEWQGIPFRELGLSLSLLKRPSAEFYSAFYSLLFSKYSKLEYLPSQWRHGKAEIASDIEPLIPQKAKVLSYGCGLGFIEKEILNKRVDIQIDGFDFADTAFKWLKENEEKINLITTLDETKQYDFIYMSHVLYALSDAEIERLFKLLKSMMKPHGKILTVDTSLNPAENGVSMTDVTPFKDLLRKLKSIFRPLYILIFKGKSYQFWGWERDNGYVRMLIENGDLQRTSGFSSSGKSFQIFELT